MTSVLFNSFGCMLYHNLCTAVELLFRNEYRYVWWKYYSPLRPTTAENTMALHAPSVAYASTTVGYTLMHSIFTFYYVNVYMERFHVSQEWFQCAQVGFPSRISLQTPGALQRKLHSHTASTTCASVYLGSIAIAWVVIMWSKRSTLTDSKICFRLSMLE